MGHRALVAYERPDRQYNLHYSHWGSDRLTLTHDITAETPFAGEEADATKSQSLFDALIAGDYDDSEDLTFPDLPTTAVSPAPWATAITREEAITEYLDFHHHEAFFVVDSTFRVTAYRTFWLGLQFDCQTTDLDHPTVGFGALKTVRWHDGEPVGDAHDRGKWEALKMVVGDMVDRDVFDEQEAIGYLKAKLIEWADSHEDLIITARPLKDRP